MSTTTPLARAIAHLSATRLGRSGEYAHYADETGLWYIVSAADMRDLGTRLARGQRDAYSLWCAASAAREVDGTEHDLLDRICDAGGAAERDYVCQCGTATGQRCEWTGHREDLVAVRWVPESDRGSASASGTYTDGGYARTLYVTELCADMLAHVYEDGGQTEELDPYVRIVGPAYHA